MSAFLILIFVLNVSCASESEQQSRQKRQLDWSGGYQTYDHMAVSSLLSPSGLPGEPGVDYPVLPYIPLTEFHCRGRLPGYYGDTQTACQVFHVCEKGGRQDSFLCPNGTIFSQKVFACDWWYNVQCSSTSKHYRLNRNLYKGSDVNLYGMPSFWNWLTDMEETFTKAPVRRPKGKSLYQSPPAPTAAPPVEPIKNRPPVKQQKYVDAGVSGISDPSKFFRWVEDASPPDYDMAPELSWANLKPDGPVMVDHSHEQVTEQAAVVRRSKPNKRREQKLIKNPSTSRLVQYYDYEEATTYAPVQPLKKLAKHVQPVMASTAALKPPVSKKTTSIQSVQMPKTIKKTVLVNSFAVQQTQPQLPIKPAVKVTPTKVSSAAAREAPAAVKKQTGIVMERVEKPKFVPSQLIPSTVSVPRRQRTRQAHYNPRLDRNYGPGHPVTKMLNWEATKL